MKQVIIARKDLNMSPGKLAAQVSHASMAFLSRMIQEYTRKCLIGYYPARKRTPGREDTVALYKRGDLMYWSEQAFQEGREGFYARPVDPSQPYGEFELCAPDYKFHCEMDIDKDLYEGWLGGIFTKIVCEAKNRAALDRVIRLANDLGLQENRDYFLIKDACLTELTPEEVDEHGTGRTLTCIGFRPLPDDIARQISKKFQLYK